MRWFELNDLGAAIGGFGQIQCALFADLWQPDPASALDTLGACRGLVIIDENVLFCLKGTWAKSADPAFRMALNDEYRAGEIFGWETIIDPKPQRIEIDYIRQEYFPTSLSLADYESSFPGRQPVSGLSVAYEASLFKENRKFPTFSVTLLDVEGHHAVRLMAQPEGRLELQ